jgi:hypothetical protein
MPGCQLADVRICYCEARSAAAISLEEQYSDACALLGGDCFGASRLAMTPRPVIAGPAIWPAGVTYPASQPGFGRLVSGPQYSRVPQEHEQGQEREAENGGVVAFNAVEELRAGSFQPIGADAAEDEVPLGR